MKRTFLFTIIINLALTFLSHTSAGTASDFYRIGVNDMLEIRVLDHDDLKTLTTVTSDGTITFPFIGNVYVKDMTLPEIEKQITKKLGEGYIKYPVITVSLVKSMSKIVIAYGELYRRGEIPYEDNMTIMKALSLAGGITDNGLYGNVKIRRYKEGKLGYTDIAIDVKNIVEGGSKGDILLQPNDVLIVERNKTFFAYGEVRRTGEFALENNMTLEKALSLAGGLQEDGLHGTVKIRRKTDDEQGYRDIEIDLKGIVEGDKSGKILLQPDDILIVERNKTFLIQGLVMNRGRFVLEKDTTAVRALMQAGGASQDGVYGKIKIRRKKEGQTGEYQDIVETRLYDGVIESKEAEDTLLQPDDILVVERSRTFLTQGETVTRGRLVLEKDTTLLKALLLAGGVTKDGLYGKIKIRRKKDGDTGEYKDIVEARLNDGIIDNKEAENTLLEPDDILVVERNETFLVYGEVLRPGEYVIQNNMTVLRAVTVAGGFTKFGSSGKVKVLRKNINDIGYVKIKVNINNVIDGDADADIKLQAGDTVIISSGIF